MVRRRLRGRRRCGDGCCGRHARRGRGTAARSSPRRCAPPRCAAGGAACGGAASDGAPRGRSPGWRRCCGGGATAARSAARGVDGSARRASRRRTRATWSSASPRGRRSTGRRWRCCRALRTRSRQSRRLGASLASWAARIWRVRRTCSVRRARPASQHRVPNYSVRYNSTIGPSFSAVRGGKGSMASGRAPTEWDGAPGTACASSRPCSAAPTARTVAAGAKFGRAQPRSTSRTYSSGLLCSALTPSSGHAATSWPNRCSVSYRRGEAALRRCVARRRDAVAGSDAAAGRRRFVVVTPSGRSRPSDWSTSWFAPMVASRARS